MLGNSFNTKDANLKKFNCLSLNGCNAISEVNIDLEMCEVFYKIKKKELPFQYVNYAVCVASARFRWSYCIGRKLRQEQFLEKLAWKGLLTAKIICEMGTTNNWLASVAFVERDWERSKTEKRLGREGTFSSAFRAFLSLPSPPLPSPPLPFFYASQATKILKTTCWEGLGLLTERKPLPSFHPLTLIQHIFAFLFISLKSLEMFIF